MDAQAGTAAIENTRLKQVSVRKDRLVKLRRNVANKTEKVRKKIETVKQYEQTRKLNILEKITLFFLNSKFKRLQENGVRLDQEIAQMR